MKEAAAWTIFYVSSAIIFGYSLGEWSTTQARGEFFAGWITEYSLSVDNLFIFILILARFKVDKTKQQLVLLVGIIMALVLRGIFIALGSAAISRYTWVFYIFGAFLLYTAYKLITESGEKEWKEGKIIAWFRKKTISHCKRSFYKHIKYNCSLSDSLPNPPQSPACQKPNPP